MIKISPSILSADFAYLARDIQAISTADYVHVDVMDGLFVPNISIGIPVVKCIRPVTDLPLDVHLMIQEPVRYVDQFCDAGADIVTCHVEADTQENILAAIDKIHAKGKKAGVVVKPRTPASAVLPFIDRVEMILVMTVEPGFGGQRFMADMMPKVQEIRRYIDAMNPGCELEVDGGVDPLPARSAWPAAQTSWWPGPPCTRRRTFPPASGSFGADAARFHLKRKILWNFFPPLLKIWWSSLPGCRASAPSPPSGWPFMC